MLAERIHQARLAAGLTLATMGERVGVSHTAIQKFEKGLLTPSSSQLLKLARACGVRTEYFFRTHTITLLHPQFRKTAAFGKVAQKALQIRVVEQIEKRIELLDAFPELPLPRFSLPTSLSARTDTAEAVERLAEAVRNDWQLGMNPVADLTDTLEGAGLLVIALEEPHSGFCGMSAQAQTEDGRTFPVIVVSRLWPGDRQRFTLAHELGHLVLEGRLAANLDIEKACDHFAGAFLAPRVAVEQRLGTNRKALEWPELHALKHEFGLSMGGWLHRARDCGVITDTTYKTMHQLFTARGWRKHEPGTPLPEEKPRLFEQLVYRALAEQHISEDKAAGLLGIPMMRFHQERQLASPDAAAHQ